MCSIFGIIDSDNLTKRSIILQKMAADQYHRGPDDGGFFEDENAALGHRRLSIIDLSSDAKQPMQSSDGNIILVFNGEIYNYQSLKKSLEAKGHKFRTASDTECIIHLFEEYGSDGFAKLDGMFAIALYDKKEKLIYLLRDRVGKKPLFYFQYGHALAFASELSALKQHDAMPRELNMQSVSDYLSLLYVPCPATIYKNVFKASPSEMLIFDIKSGILSKQKYHTDSFKINTSLSFEESSERLRELVFEAVRKRLMSDVPVGVFLSGGVDSGITANIMTRLRMPQKTDAFTIGFDDPVYDESSTACRTAAFINSQTDNALIHHRKNVSASDFNKLKMLVKHYGEPYADASMIPTALLSEFTREQVTVALSGDGADELFAGYDRYFLMSKIRYFNLLPYFARHFIFKTMSDLIPGGNERSRIARIKRAFEVISNKENIQYYALLDRCKSDFKSNLAGTLFKDELNKLKQNSVIELLDNLSSPSATGKYLEFDRRTYLVGDILTKTDIASMAYSLELRCPFLDKDVIAFADSMPFEYKLQGGDKKHILKNAFKDFLPDEVIRGGKKGFGVPVANYLRTVWRKDAEEILFGSENLSRSGIFNMEFLRRIWNTHQTSTSDYSYQLWTVLMFALFLETE